MEGIHFPILINAPKEIPITKETHSNLSVFGLGAFMLSYPVAISDEPDKIVIYTNESRAYEWNRQPRFKEEGVKGWVIRSVEMGGFDIPKTTTLYKTIEKYFKHLYFKS